MLYERLVYNISFKSMKKQNNEIGDTFFEDMKEFEFKKEVSPDRLGFFIMSDSNGLFYVFKFNFFTKEIETIKKNIISKEKAHNWLTSNRTKFEIAI